jgi:hypothetical protein
MEKILKVNDTFNGNEIKQNSCPNCGSNDLAYNGSDFDGEFVTYPYVCNQCDIEGAEYFSLKFEGHNIEIEEEEIGKDMGESTTYAIVDEYLSGILNNMQMDKPENFHEIVEFISKDIEETADVDFSYGDVVIGFRRFIEKN